MNDQEIEKALAEEFSGYLRAISREIVVPIRDTVTKQKAEIDRLVNDVQLARTEIGSVLSGHHNELASEGKYLIDSVARLCREMEVVVSGAAAGHVVTRDVLLSEAKWIGSVVNESALRLSTQVKTIEENINGALVRLGVEVAPALTRIGSEVEASIKAKVETGIEIASRKISGVLAGLIRNDLSKMQADLRLTLESSSEVQGRAIDAVVKELRVERHRGRKTIMLLGALAVGQTGLLIWLLMLAN